MFRFSIGRIGDLTAGMAWQAARAGPLAARLLLEYDRYHWTFGATAGLASGAAYVRLHLGCLDVSLEVAGPGRRMGA